MLSGPLTALGRSGSMTLIGGTSLTALRVRCALLLVALAGIARPASAADVAVPGTATSVEIHGFASPGFLISTDNNYLARSKRGSFEFTETGLNFTVQLTEKLRTGMQLFARQLGKTGGF